MKADLSRCRTSLSKRQPRCPKMTGCPQPRQSTESRPAARCAGSLHSSKEKQLDGNKLGQAPGLGHIAGWRCAKNHDSRAGASLAAEEVAGGRLQPRSRPSPCGSRHGMHGLCWRSAAGLCPSGTDRRPSAGKSDMAAASGWGSPQCQLKVALQRQRGSFVCNDPP